jgi:hypothetical protein
LKTLPVDCLVNLSHTNISILYHNHCQYIPEHTGWGVHTCSWSKSRARSVLYNRAWNLPMMNKLKKDASTIQNCFTYMNMQNKSRNEPIRPIMRVIT